MTAMAHYSVEMKNYIGTKTVRAKQMRRGDYNTLRGWTTPLNEDADDAGYIVEYHSSDTKPNHINFEHHITWLPQEVFEKSYRVLDNSDTLSFPQALEALKAGKRIARIGWEGKGMFLWIRPTMDFTPIDLGLDTTIKQPDQSISTGTICMYTYDSTGRASVFPSWHISEHDMLSDDWKLVGE
jgi:hypothetical protein